MSVHLPLERRKDFFKCFKYENLLFYYKLYKFNFSINFDKLSCENRHVLNLNNIN